MSDKSAEEIKTWLQQNAVQGETIRSKRLDRYLAHYECTQYQHLQQDWSGMSADQMETVSPVLQVPIGFDQPGMSSNLAVRSKRPTAPTNLAKAITDRFTGLLLSESRQPEIRVEGDPDTEAFLEAAMEQMRFWPELRKARNMGGGSGSVLVTAHLNRKGEFALQIHRPGICQFVWEDRRSLKPLAVLLSYRYSREEDILDPKTHMVTGTRMVDYLYRRIITAVDDTVYKDVKLEPGSNMAWEVEDVNEHNLGFFPGVWIQNLARAEDVDGDPDCQGAWQMMDTLDRMLAQMNKALLLNLDPTPVVKADPQTVAAQGGTVWLGSNGAISPGLQGDAKYMEFSGGAITVAMGYCTSLEQQIMKVVRCVFVNPEQLSGAAQSAKAIEYIMALMIEKTDDLRSQYGDLGIIPLLRIVEGIARKKVGNQVDLGNGEVGITEIRLPPRPGPDGKLAPPKLGPGGWITLKWGPYFAPTEDDKGKAIKNVNDAKTGGLITSETAVRHGAPILDVRDVDAEISGVERERAEQVAMGMEQLRGGGGGVTEDDLVDKKGPAAGAGGRP